MNMSCGSRAVVVILGLCVASCSTPTPRHPVPEAEYSTAIIGSWQGTVGGERERLTIAGDGTFVCELHATGFIANTLSLTVPGTIRGTWKMTGANITLSITDVEHERLLNKTASSTIVAFEAGALTLKSDRGDRSTFRRVRPL